MITTYQRPMTYNARFGERGIRNGLLCACVKGSGERYKGKGTRFVIVLVFCF